MINDKCKIKNRIFKVAIVFLIILLICSCAGTKNIPQEETDIQVFSPAKHLVFIGLDGWGGAYVAKAHMPTVKRMMNEGSSSIEYIGVMPSNSWPNWSALFNGASLTDQNTENFPSIISLINKNKPEYKSVFFYEWSEMKNICRNDNIDIITIESKVESATLIAEYIIAEKPNFTSVVFNQPDSVGHGNRWGSAAYYEKLTELDTYIALIEKAVKDSGIYNETVFILSADHGGVLWGHGFRSSKQRRIPLVICGKNIKKGFNIPVHGSITDIAPTMALVFGLDIPREWTGRPIRGVIQ